mmetsp:Transcript_126588/g.253103  ORF Transcript_126588/g.253103 Transcript_126588/m.253103 type:complete len:237 (-) Transcript_126588:476-1186(-)
MEAATARTASEPPLAPPTDPAARGACPRHQRQKFGQRIREFATAGLHEGPSGICGPFTVEVPTTSEAQCNPLLGFEVPLLCAGVERAASDNKVGSGLSRCKSARNEGFHDPDPRHPLSSTDALLHSRAIVPSRGVSNLSKASSQASADRPEPEYGDECIARKASSSATEPSHSCLKNCSWWCSWSPSCSWRRSHTGLVVVAEGAKSDTCTPVDDTTEAAGLGDSPAPSAGNAPVVS